MSFSEPFLTLPPSQKRAYIFGRILLYTICTTLALWFALRIIFPTLPFSFNFKTPQSTKNTFLDPRRATDQSPLLNGKLEEKQTLIGNFDSPGTFSRLRVSLTLNKKSAEPSELQASLSRSYRSFFLPIDGIPVASFEHPPLYQDQNGIYYAEENGALKRFVSPAAYLSRYPASFALPLSSSLARSLPLSEEWIGFRVGSLVSFADGVYLVVSEQEIRPFGDPNIFLSLGYRFKDVIPAHEEEIGIYKRGRIILYGAPQSDGTLFYDTDSGAYLIRENKKLRPITSPEYRKFLLTQITPLEVSLASRNTTLSCTPTPSWFGKKYTCDIPEASLSAQFGSAFQFFLRSDTNIDIDTLTVSLITDRTSDNFRLFAHQIRLRLMNRLGLSQ